MTKATIIQRLLDEKRITAEEAMILMASEPTPVPIQPYNPYSPPFEPGDWPRNPEPPYYYYTTDTTYRED